MTTEQFDLESSLKRYVDLYIGFPYYADSYDIDCLNEVEGKDISQLVRELLKAIEEEGLIDSSFPSRISELLKEWEKPAWWVNPVKLRELLSPLVAKIFPPVLEFGGDVRGSYGCLASRSGDTLTFETFGAEEDISIREFLIRMRIDVSDFIEAKRGEA